MITRVLLSRDALTPRLISYDCYSVDGRETHGKFAFTIRTDDEGIAEAKRLWPEASIEVHHHTSGEYAYRARQSVAAETVSEAALGGRCQWGNSHWNNRG